MRKIELTEAEAAAVSTAISREIGTLFAARVELKIKLAGAGMATPNGACLNEEDQAALDYFAQQSHLLHIAKAKLERDETEDHHG